MSAAWEEQLTIPANVDMECTSANSIAAINKTVATKKGQRESTSDTFKNAHLDLMKDVVNKNSSKKEITNHINGSLLAFDSVVPSLFD